MCPRKSKYGLDLDHVRQKEDNRNDDRGYGDQLPGSAGTTVRMLVIIVILPTSTGYRSQTNKRKGDASKDGHEISEPWRKEGILIDARDAKFFPSSTSKAG